MFVSLCDARDALLSFDAAWDRAMAVGFGRTVLTTTTNPPEGAVRWTTDSATRAIERDALLATRDGWRRAYQRRPATVRERSVTELLRALQEPVLEGAPFGGNRSSRPNRGPLVGWSRA
jgi:hypothetical protein